MAQRGYVYVLANSAMPGLVKVGRTSRSANDRAVELSGVTGLPSPFIVVYEEEFNDCIAAEKFIHAHLSKCGHRISGNREFFNAPVNEVVRSVSMAKANDGEHESTSSWENHESNSPPWQDLFEQAEKSYFGYGEEIQDYKRALKLYLQAAKLGCLPAYSRIGEVYWRGYGTPVDQDKALEYLRDGSNKGCVYSAWLMGQIFLGPPNYNSKISKNAEKCFARFVNNLFDENGSYRISEVQFNDILRDCLVMLLCREIYMIGVPKSLRDFYVNCSGELDRASAGFFEGVLSMGWDAQSARSHIEGIKVTIETLKTVKNLGENGRGIDVFMDPE